MDIAKDIVDKYTTEQIIAYLDRLVGDINQNYKVALKVCKAEPLWISMGDISQVKAILHEMNKQNQERAARARANQSEL